MEKDIYVKLINPDYILSELENIGFDKIENQQIEKFSDKLNLKFDKKSLKISRKYAKIVYKDFNAVSYSVKIKII